MCVQLKEGLKSSQILTRCCKGTPPSIVQLRKSVWARRHLTQSAVSKPLWQWPTHDIRWCLQLRVEVGRMSPTGAAEPRGLPFLYLEKSITFLSLWVCSSPFPFLPVLLSDFWFLPTSSRFLTFLLIFLWKGWNVELNLVYCRFPRCSSDTVLFDA